MDHREDMSAEVMRGICELAVLRQFPGSPKEFWPRFITCAAHLAGAEAIVLLLGNSSGTPRWTKIGESWSGSGASPLRATFQAQLESAAEHCLTEGGLCGPLEHGFVLGVRLKLSQPQEQVALICLVAGVRESSAREVLVRLNLARDTPELYQVNLASLQARTDVEKFATVLDLMVPVNLEKRFLAAVFALCNGVASRLRCDRVGLGWGEAG
jgi:hypothetical protein